MKTRSDFVGQVAEEGFAILPNVLAPGEVQKLLLALENISAVEDGRRRGGVRNLLETAPLIRELARSSSLRTMVEPILGDTWFPVRAILFDKNPEANWKVPWHQDLSIAVQKRVDVEGFGSWSMKAGVQHVQPPAALLENMLAVRLHLDDCDETNGPVRVIPGTHKYGRIPESEIQSYAERSIQDCLVPTGGVLLMRPLLLHASSPSQSPKHRRVIHIEYAAQSLPDGLLWHSESANRIL